ncbi:hypothetical protein LCGC14_3104880 [marine sediment metagenome]|uniref:Uncharacterized protein n=1 Tax=marine sediment metagenome TaxID=412755 RepID=A0A0F8W6T1_9ZZZZ
MGGYDCPPPPSLTNVEQFPGDIVIVDISGYTRFVKMLKVYFGEKE